MNSFVIKKDLHMLKKQKNCDEADLFECVWIIYKKRKLILSTVFIFLAISVIVSLLTPEVYEASAMIKLDTLTQVDKQDAYRTIKSISIPPAFLGNSKLSSDNSESKIIFEDIQDNCCVKIKIQSHNPAIAFKKCSFLAESFIAARKINSDKAGSLINERIKTLSSSNEKIKQISVMLKKENYKKVYKKNLLILWEELTNYEVKTNSLNEEAYKFKRQFLNYSEPKIVEMSILSINSVKIIIMKNAIIFTNLGLMLSIFIAFVQGFCLTY